MQASSVQAHQTPNRSLTRPSSTGSLDGSDMPARGSVKRSSAERGDINGRGKRPALADRTNRILAEPSRDEGPSKPRSASKKQKAKAAAHLLKGAKFSARKASSSKSARKADAVGSTSQRLSHGDAGPSVVQFSRASLTQPFHPLEVAVGEPLNTQDEDTFQPSPLPSASAAAGRGCSDSAIIASLERRTDRCLHISSVQPQSSRGQNGRALEEAQEDAMAQDMGLPASVASSRRPGEASSAHLINTTGVQAIGGAPLPRALPTLSSASHLPASSSSAPHDGPSFAAATSASVWAPLQNHHQQQGMAVDTSFAAPVIADPSPAPMVDPPFVIRHRPRAAPFQRQAIVDIDANFADPQMAALYAPEIYANMRNNELRRLPTPGFMEPGTGVQGDINPNMRGILVDWLVEVAEEYRLVPDTLYLACSLIDLHLSSIPVTRARLQLLGVASMLIASKYEEIYPPSVDEFCYITDNTYRREEILEMERSVLRGLRFDLSLATTKTFLRRCVRAAQTMLPAPSLRLEFMCNYIAELSLLDYSVCVTFLPSVRAAASVLLASHTLDPTTPSWDPTMQHYSGGYSPSQLADCVRSLHSLLVAASNSALPAVREKYRQARFQSVSSIPVPEFLPPHLFVDLVGV